MITGKSLLGKAIVGQADGSHIGKVKDLLFDHDTDELVSLVLENKDLFGLMDAVIVPLRNVVNLGGDVIVVADKGATMHLKDDARSNALSQRETALSGTQVLSTDGQQLGTLADMVIDEQTGRVMGYQVSEGFISDTLHGKKFISAPPGLSIGQNAAIASPSAAAAIKS